jgi:hypothetical protein
MFNVGEQKIVNFLSYGVQFFYYRRATLIREEVADDIPNLLCFL